MWLGNINSLPSNRRVQDASSGLDPDASAFLIATGITNPTGVNAINTLVIDLKAANVWSLLQAIYPIIGGTATTHKYNLKDPQDTDAAFRITFYGGWTHGSTGMTPNGSTGYADTYFSLTTDLVSYVSNIMGIYSRTSGSTGIDIGSSSSNVSFPAANFNTTISPSNATETFVYGATTTNTIPLTIGTQGFINQVRENGTTYTAYADGVAIGSNPTNMYANPNSLSDLPMYLGARNTSGGADEFSDGELAFAVLGPSLTGPEVLDLYNAIQTYQTALSRQV
jgi:hypothetical protein